MTRKMALVDEARPKATGEADTFKRSIANHLKYDLAHDQYTATDHDRYQAVALAVRDRMVRGWMNTQQTHHLQRAKRVYYFSLEFLMGRALANNVLNLGLQGTIGDAFAQLHYDWEQLREEEVEPGLGNGGLGRLAACFLDSLATLEIPAFGYGIRYDYGIFRQRIHQGQQAEEPDDWLQSGNPWEIPRPDLKVHVHFGGRVESTREHGRLRFRWVNTEPVVGIPYDIPIVGYNCNTVNTLRLWSARAHSAFSLEDFNRGDYVRAVEHKVHAENLTKVLYPNDKVYAGQELRLRQQYFFVACSLSDILRRFKKDWRGWEDLPELVAIQLNDTHPALAVPELMRLLVDHEGLEWDYAWKLVVQTFGYTNHTLLPEALETWPVTMLERLLPRHLQIIYEINHRFLEDIVKRYPNDTARLARLSLVQEAPERRIRMANLAIVGSHSTNGVARLHTELLRERVVPEFAELYPERFNSKTNGVTPRRWLLMCNPGLSGLLRETIGNAWESDLTKLRQLIPHCQKVDFLEQFALVKKHNKVKLATWLKLHHGYTVAPDSMFDVQIKRIHEYKRQLLNALHIVSLYVYLREHPHSDMTPRTCFFGGKAAPGYHMAKLIIKFINNLAEVINHDPRVRGRLRVFFLPDYNVSLAERIIPAADLSEQISTAGMEASGTGNMKLMMNGALTIGTLDGANIEIMEEVGRENVFIFGLNAEEVVAKRKNYQPRECYAQDPLIKATLDLIFSGHFNPLEPGLFEPLRQALLEYGDYYMHLADLPSYMAAQRQAGLLFRDRMAWSHKAALNVACSGKFSSDRTILEYAKEIWKAKAVPIRDNPPGVDTVYMARGDLERQHNGG